MVAPKHSLLTMPFGQGPAFKPLPTAKRRPALRTIDDLRVWFANAPGETYANEVVVNPSGAWTDITQQPPAPLTEVLRLTLPRPEPVTLVCHPWLDDDTRFRFALRMYAEMASSFPVAFNANGRIIVEWGVGAARNWTYLDCAPGSLHIPTCQWLAVSAWTYNTRIRLAATAQVGYSHGPHDATWTCTTIDNVINSCPRYPPHYSREVTGYFNGFALASEGTLHLIDSVLSTYQTFLIRSHFVPNPQATPYAPVKVPLSGGIAILSPTISNPAGGTCACSAVVTIRL